MDKQGVGGGLRRLRRMLDLEQKEVAERLGITPAAYSHWENGRTELRVSDLVRLSYSLRVPLGTLMRFLDIPIEDRVLSPGQWVDSGAASPLTPSGTIPAAASGNTTESAAGNTASESAKRPLPRAKWRFDTAVLAGPMLQPAHP